MGRQMLVHNINYLELTILLTSSADPGSTEQVDAWELEETA